MHSTGVPTIASRFLGFVSRRFVCRAFIPVVAQLAGLSHIQPVCHQYCYKKQ